MDTTSLYQANSNLFAIVSQQVQEMELVRRKIFELEHAQVAIKQKLVAYNSIHPRFTRLT